MGFLEKLGKKIKREVKGDFLCDIEKVSDMLRYAEFGVMVTPALVVDGKVAVTGRVPSLDEVKSMLGNH